jgi:hypothetical protein
VKISSHAFICEGVTIEDEVFAGHGVVLINDRYPRATTTDGELQAEAGWECIRTPRRDALRAWLWERGVAIGIHYPVPIHLQKAFREFGWGTSSLPGTERFASEVLSLPMYPELETSAIEYIAHSVKELWG